MQPIKIWNGPPGTGPNPWKPVLVLEELHVPYEFVWIPYSDIKSEPYLSLNPNGRFPAMVDPNTNVTLFESGAIMLYLVARYDKESKLTYGDDRLEEKWQLQSWLMFQMSGQGPIFGQKTWFENFHKDINVVSAIERFREETARIVGVIDSHLGKQRKKIGSGEDIWLVGDKCTFADLSFVPWNLILLAHGGSEYEEKYPEFWQWHQAITSRPIVKRVVDMREEAVRTMEDTAKPVLPERH